MATKHRGVHLFFIIITLCFNTFSQENDKTRKYTNDYMYIGVGARSLAMSQASVCSSNDVSAAYWNPAGLLDIQSNLQITAMHSEYFGGITNYDYAAIATKVDSNSAIAFSLIRHSVDNIPNTLGLITPDGNINYDNITTFSAPSYGFLFSYAKNLGLKGLKIGGSGKVIHRRAGDFVTAWGFGLDLGVRYDYNQWRFGLMAKDITTTYSVWNFNFSDDMAQDLLRAGNELPEESSVEIALPRFTPGIARSHTIKNKVSILAELNFEITTDGRRYTLVNGDLFSIDPDFGLEATYSNIIFLRAGIGNFQKIKNDFGDQTSLTFQPNIGVGLKFMNLYVDYAFTDVGDQSIALYSHVFSLKLDMYKEPIR